MRFLFSLLLVVCTMGVWLLPGCTTDQEASSVLCPPMQLVRCNSCPATCSSNSGSVCRGWLQCSSDGTAFVGKCSDCAAAPADEADDSCASLNTCCARSSLPASDQATCSDTVTANDADTCYALLNQYLSAQACGSAEDGGEDSGIKNPPPPPPPDSSVPVAEACNKLAPCCDAAGHTAEQSGACSSLVSQANDTACADATQLYCSKPTKGKDAGSGKDATTHDTSTGGGDAAADVSMTNDGTFSEDADGGDDFDGGDCTLFDGAPCDGGF